MNAATETPQPSDLSAAEQQTTLDRLLRAHARGRPDALALVDSHPAEPGRRLRFCDLDRAVDRLAGQLQGLGLAPGAAVAIQGANCIETIVALLGTVRGGFVAAPIPLLWGHAEAANALAGIEARALIAAPAAAGAHYAATALRIAADTFSMRYVLRFGMQAPDGVVPLGDVFAQDGPQQPAESGRSALETTLVTFETGAEGHVAHARNDAALLVGGAAVALTAGIRGHAAILGTMLPSSFAALASTVVPWLLTGGVLALCHTFDADMFAALAADIRADVAILPGPLTTPLAEAGVIGRADGPTVLGLWRAPEQHRSSTDWTAPSRLVDILAFGEAGFVPLPRGPRGEPATLKMGTITAQDGGRARMMVATLGRTQAGTLAFGGPMLPSPPAGATSAAAPVEPTPFDTGFRCTLAADGSLSITAAPPGLVSIGGHRFALEDLRSAVGRAAPEGVLAALPDLLTGQKLAGSGADLAAIRQTLSEGGASPLLASAFRERQAG